MAQSHIATAADYADAMIAARRAKHWLFFILLIVLLVQLALFFVARYTDSILPSPAADASMTMTMTATTHPAVAAREPETLAGRFAHYALGLTTFAGMTVPAVLAVVLLLIVMIMVVGRLIGVSRLVSAFIWCIVLAVLLFPWQFFFAGGDLKIPGVLFTWRELRQAKFDGSQFSSAAVLHWARFVVLPLVALIILLAVQGKSNRGLRLALGEAPVESGDTDATVA